MSNIVLSSSGYSYGKKGQHAALIPHQLLMTATPIPRTLAMTQWAHLDSSIIVTNYRQDEKPW